jgi:hypothetical protein
MLFYFGYQISILYIKWFLTVYMFQSMQHMKAARELNLYYHIPLFNATEIKPSNLTV